ncbi:unnamed protein product [Ilex paraguariensis]|uniref:Protein LYK2 n=1 Tax=Ilex paraguariensis TaxID=185542 RepID=A0ABC8SX88_9AQUA
MAIAKSLLGLPMWKLQLTAYSYFIWAIASALGQNSLSCDSTFPDASGYRCNGSGSHDQCRTYALIRANSFYSSLFNLSFYLGINQSELADANGFPADMEFLPKDHPLLIPIHCKCNDGLFEAVVTKTTIKGESFYGIAESLEGLTTCKAIREKNPGVSPWELGEKLQLLIPLRCACPSSLGRAQQLKLLLSYPISQGDTIFNLALKFNTSAEAVISVNSNRSEATFKPESLVPLSTLLIPLNGMPNIGSLAKPDLGYPATSIPVVNLHRKKSKKWKIGLYIALSGIAFGAIIAVTAAFLVIQRRRRKKQNSCKMVDMELQQVSLSIRSSSKKKVSFETSQNLLELQILNTTPRKVVVEIYSIKELRKATEDFNSGNLIEDSIFYGRLNGKNLAIKKTQRETVSKVEFELFQDPIHHHPNIIRLLGTCVTEGPDSFLVFEYAKNGSLKDWLHGGLAMKSQFIASCYCFLTWNQRLKICLDVATGLQYMHHIMNPRYVHRNIKSRNIFLDEEFNAKIGNFGMASCVDDDSEDQKPYSSHIPSWSKGYLAPECYLHKNLITPSIDIFAYGVVLLEILSGQTPITGANEREEGSVWLSEKIKIILQSDNADELREWMDSALGENYSFEAAVTLANLARACVEDNPSLRPNAGEIVDKLLRLVDELPEEGEQFSICESSCKPLVKAVANNMGIPI